MSRQVTISRTELGLSDLLLNDPDNGFYVSDEWSTGGIIWQRYNASESPWVDGEHIIGQRKTGVEEIITVHVFAPTPADLKTRFTTVADALSQYRYTLTINWDGAEYVFQANGAGDLKVSTDNVDPVLHRAGWQSLVLTIPRDPGLG